MDEWRKDREIPGKKPAKDPEEYLRPSDRVDGIADVREIAQKHDSFLEFRRETGIEEHRAKHLLRALGEYKKFQGGMFGKAYINEQARKER